jgi:hypothetical protein
MAAVTRFHATLLLLACIPTLFVLACLTSGSRGASRVNAEPRVVLERTTWDFGRVPAGSKLLARFPVKNAGDRRLVLRQQVSSCECIASEAQSTIILQPGRSTTLEAQIDTTKLQGACQLELTFKTSAPNLPTFQLKLLADVQPSRDSGDPAP